MNIPQWVMALARDEAMFTFSASQRLGEIQERLRTSPADVTDAEIVFIGKSDGDARGAWCKREGARAKRVSALRPKDLVFRSAALERLNAHAIELAIKYGIRVERSRGRGVSGHADYRTRTAYLSDPVTNEETYCVALHEFGHLVCPDADSRQFPFRIEKCDEDAGHKWAQVSPAAETGAWRWAAEHAIEWTSEMQQRMFVSLRSHVKQASPAEREEMQALVRDRCLRVQGKAWATFEELDERLSEFEGAGTSAIDRRELHAAPLAPLSAAAPELASRIEALEKSVETLASNRSAAPDPELAKRVEVLEELVEQRYDAGVFTDGKTYQRGAGVSFDGAFYVAQRTTRATPGPGSDGDWRTAVRRGKQGKDGRPGKDADPEMVRAILREVLREEGLIS